MAEMKHTCGPWRVDDETSDFDIYIVGRPAWKATRYGRTGEWDVAAVEILDDHPVETKANARLIAAAPELLEALKGAIGALEFSRDCHGDTSNEDQAFAQRKLDAAVSAIAKAEGR